MAKVGDKIQIRVCGAFGPQFMNLLPNTIHTIIKPPKGFKNNRDGYWVMGVGEPVRVLKGEFNFIE